MESTGDSTIMPSKYEGELKHYLQAIKNSTGLNLRMSNDGNRHFIKDDQGHTFGHGETIGDLYSSIFFCENILSFVKQQKKAKRQQRKEEKTQ